MTVKLREPKTYDGKLSAREVAKFLRQLSRTYDDPKTGNPALSRALSEIASALGEHDTPLSKCFSKSNGSRPKKAPPRSYEFVGIGLDKVNEIISQPDISKLTLIELGLQRFGIPKSALMRLNIRQVIDKIQSAVRNEESLHIISQQARKSGASRSS